MMLNEEDSSWKMNQNLHVPDIFLVGVQKARITAFQSLLLAHPRICDGNYKEKHYFDFYRAPKIQVDRSRLKEIIPPLFLSRYDPSPIAKEVMGSLWENIIPDDQKANLVISLENEILAYLTLALHSR